MKRTLLNISYGELNERKLLIKLEMPLADVRILKKKN